MYIVRIVLEATRDVVAEIPISFQGMNYAPSHEELNSEAWKTAIEDDLVDKERRADYEFIISKS